MVRKVLLNLFLGFGALINIDGGGSRVEGDGFSIFGNPLLSIGDKALAIERSDPKMAFRPLILLMHNDK